MSTRTELESFLTLFEERAAPREEAVREAWWKLATTGTEEAREELVRAGTEYNELFSDAEELAQVREWYEDRRSLSPLLRRQAEVLYRMYAAHQGDRETLERIEELEADANAAFSNHRATVGCREISENGLRHILRHSDDEGLRREAWEASRSVGREVEGTVRELARLRNRLARERGYSDHYQRALDLQEIDVGELEGIMAGLEEATEAPFRELRSGLDAELGARFGTDTVMPWHLPDPFFQHAPEQPGLDVDRFFADSDLEALARETYDSLGLDVRAVLARSDLYERDGKGQHAFCLPVSRVPPYDVRVLANLRPDAYWADALLHELGHAVHDANINPKLPYLLRTVAHTATTEAMALTMGGLSTDPGWLSGIAGVSEGDLDREKLAARRRAEGLVFVRWALVMHRFEQALYADPDREDLNGLWWDLVERLQLQARPPGRDEPDWAAKIHFAVAPVYYHNYVLGHLIAAQLRGYLESHITHGPFHQSEAAGRYLQEALFGPGARESWRGTVHRATGEPLNPEHFVEEIS